MIFTFIYEYDGTVQAGPGLVFIALPLAFSKMGLAGNIISVLFLCALLFAGITSTISLLEPFVLFLIDRFGLSRFKATYWVSIAVFIMGVKSLLLSICFTLGKATAEVVKVLSA